MDTNQNDAIVCEDNKDTKSVGVAIDVQNNQKVKTASEQRVKTDIQVKIFAPERSRSHAQQRSSTSNNAVIAQSKLDRVLKKPNASHVPAHVKAPFKTAPDIKRLPRSRPGSGTSYRPQSAKSASSCAPNLSNTTSGRSRTTGTTRSNTSRSRSAGSSKPASNYGSSHRNNSVSRIGQRQLSKERLVS